MGHIPDMEAIDSRSIHDDRRLECADWLESHGQSERAEFVRLQCDIAANNLFQTHEKCRRASELLWTNWDEWTAPLRALGIWTRRHLMPEDEYDVLAEFRRGFVEKLTLTAEQFLLLGPRIAQAAPTIRSLTLRNTFPILEALSNGEDWRRISGFQDPVPLMRSLSTWKELSAPIMGLHLNMLNLSVFGLTAAALEDLLVWPIVRHDLTELTLWGNRIGNEGAQAIASVLRFSPIEHLDLSANGIGDGGAKALSDSEGFERLVRLDLRANPITPLMAEKLRSRFGDRVIFDADSDTCE